MTSVLFSAILSPSIQRFTHAIETNEGLPRNASSFSCIGFSSGSFSSNQGHPNKMFRFPSSSTRKVGSVGRTKKNVFFKWYFEKKWVGRAMGNETIYWDGLTTRSTQGPFTLHQIFGTARIQMVRVPKSRVRFIHLHFNFFPC